jgi:hypothetical protein
LCEKVLTHHSVHKSKIRFWSFVEHVSIYLSMNVHLYLIVCLSHF